MTPYCQSGPVTLYCGDSLAIMPTLPAASVDAIVTEGEEKRAEKTKREEEE